MALNDYVTLGRSGLRVSPLCLGAMTFGNDWGWGSDVPTSQRIIDRFIARGGNFIDTANIYTKGHSEKIIGDHLAHDRAKRDRVVIATKFMGNMYTGDPNGGGAGRKAIIAACEQSLRRLRTDYIDLYWMHWHDPYTPIVESMRAMDDLVSSGKVRYIGVSDTPAWRVALANTEARHLGRAGFIALQIEYSLLERTVEGDLIPMALELGLGVTPWSPLRGGVLSGKYTRENAASSNPGRGQWVMNNFNERTWALLDVLRSVAAEAKRGDGKGASMAQVALAWVQSKPGVTLNGGWGGSSIIGARTLEQLDDNIDALGVVLTPGQVQKLDEASKPALAFPHDFLQFATNNAHGGASINGRRSEPWHLAPKNDAERH